MNKSHLTAIPRKTPSKPCRVIEELGLLKNCGRLLDYGCGKGKDVEHLNCEGYDIYYQPELPKRKFDTILCTYVLNMMPIKEQRAVIKHIRSILKRKGVAYITVRRDFKEDYLSKKGTYQYVVELKEEVLLETDKFCIYKVSQL